MNTEQFFNVLNSEVIDRLLDYYNSASEYETFTMNKLNPKGILPDLLELIEDKLNKKLEYVTGNFYQHSLPYAPHTDYKTYQQNTVNMVIPLRFTEALPYLVIFDQIWPLDSVTWSMNKPVMYFEYNIGVKGCPYEYPILGKTEKDFDVEFHAKYLNQYPIECLKDLSAKAYSFEPGSIIIFDNRRIHCTANFTGVKTGLTLRFK